MDDMTPLGLPGIGGAMPDGARRAADFYPTPMALWRPFAPVLAERLHLSGADAIVEPACGDGRVLSWLAGMERPGGGELAAARTLVGFDVRAEAVEATRARGYDAHECDWLTPAPLAHLPGGTLAMVTNPPFCIGVGFARACIERVGLQPGTGSGSGLVALLLRITWLEPTEDRAALLADYPADVWVPPTRGRFANGATDSATAAWFVWPPAYPGEGHRVRYLGRHAGP